MRFTFDHYIEREDEEFELAVEYSAAPFIPATYWQPAEGGDVEIISVKHQGKTFSLTDDEDKELLEICQARVADDFADEADNYADWKYEEYRDRLFDD